MFSLPIIINMASNSNINPSTSSETQPPKKNFSELLQGQVNFHVLAMLPKFDDEGKIVSPMKDDESIFVDSLELNALEEKRKYIISNSKSKLNELEKHNREVVGVLMARINTLNKEYETMKNEEERNTNETLKRIREEISEKKNLIVTKRRKLCVNLDENSKKLEEILDCTICTSKLKPPLMIFQCRSGHVICNNCKIVWGNQSCTECRDPFGYGARAKPLENMMKTRHLRNEERMKRANNSK